MPNPYVDSVYLATHVHAQILRKFQEVSKNYDIRMGLTTHIGILGKNKSGLCVVYLADLDTEGGCRRTPGISPVSLLKAIVRLHRRGCTLGGFVRLSHISFDYWRNEDGHDPEYYYEDIPFITLTPSKIVLTIYSSNMRKYLNNQNILLAPKNYRPHGAS